MRSTGLRSFGADTKREYAAKTQLIRDRETGPSSNMELQHEEYIYS